MRLLPPILALSLTACVPVTQTPVEAPAVNGSVICEETQTLRSAVVTNVLETTDQKLGVSAGNLILSLDAACAGT